MKKIAAIFSVVATALVVSGTAVRATDSAPVQAQQGQRDPCLLSGLTAEVACPCSFRSLDQKIVKLNQALASGAYSAAEQKYLAEEREQLSRLHAYNNNRLPSYQP